MLYRKDILTLDAKKYIKRYFDERGLNYPKEALDSFLFLVSEVGELSDVMVTQRGDWVRNHPDKERDLEFELADIYMMLAITADLLGVDLDKALVNKITEKGFGHIFEEGAN